MNAGMLQDTADELEEMGTEILNILEVMERLVQNTRSTNPIIYDRARAYWISHIRMAMKGPAMATFHDTVSEIRAEAEWIG